MVRCWVASIIWTLGTFRIGMRRFRDSIIRLAESLISVFPDSLWSTIAYLWLKVESKREPEEAMRRSLEVEEYLTRQINAVALR